MQVQYLTQIFPWSVNITKPQQIPALKVLIKGSAVEMNMHYQIKGPIPLKM